MAELKEGIVGGALNLYFIYKFLRILTTPWENTDAFKLGIIDEKGGILKKKRTLLKIEEKEAYTMMHRLVTIWKVPPSLLCCRPMVDQRRKILLW